MSPAAAGRWSPTSERRYALAEPSSAASSAAYSRRTCPHRRHTNTASGHDDDPGDDPRERLDHPFDLQPAITEHVPDRRQADAPDERAHQRVHRESPERHRRNAGRQAHEGPDEGDEPPIPGHGLAVALEPIVGPVDLVRSDQEVPAEAVDRGPAARVAPPRRRARSRSASPPSPRTRPRPARTLAPHP